MFSFLPFLLALSRRSFCLPLPLGRGFRLLDQLILHDIAFCILFGLFLLLAHIIVDLLGTSISLWLAATGTTYFKDVLKIRDCAPTNFLRSLSKIGRLVECNRVVRRVVPGV